MPRNRLLISKSKILIWSFSIGLLTLLTSINCPGQEKASFDFDKKEFLKPQTLAESTISMSASPDNGQISTLFDNFTVSLQSEKDQLSSVAIAGLTVPVKTIKGKPFIYYSQHLRGEITKDANSRVVIFLDAGGKTSIIEFPYGRKQNVNLQRSFPLKLKTVKNMNYSVVLTIFVERRSVKDTALVQIDSFDSSVQSTPPKSKKKNNT